MTSYILYTYTIFTAVHAVAEILGGQQGPPPRAKKDSAK